MHHWEPIVKEIEILLLGFYCFYIWKYMRYIRCVTNRDADALFSVNVTKAWVFQINPIFQTQIPY